MRSEFDSTSGASYLHFNIPVPFAEVYASEVGGQEHGLHLWYEAHGDQIGHYRVDPANDKGEHFVPVLACYCVCPGLGMMGHFNGRATLAGHITDHCIRRRQTGKAGSLTGITSEHLYWLCGLNIYQTIPETDRWKYPPSPCMVIYLVSHLLSNISLF